MATLRTAPEALPALLHAAIERAAGGLFERQRGDGSWQDRLPSSAVATGAAIIGLHALDAAAHRDVIAAGAAWLRDTQLDDGSWGDTPDGDRTINATAIAAGALATVAGAASSAAIARAQRRIELLGGDDLLEDRARCTMSTVCLHFLADGGLYPRERLGRLPLELILMPRGLQRKLCFTLPGLLSWGVMQARTRPAGPLVRRVNRLAEPRALAWLERLQQVERHVGGFEESPLMVGVVAYGLGRAGAGAAIAARCRAYLLATQRADGSWPINRDLELSASMFVAMGLQEAGFAGDPRLATTVAWMRACQRREPFFATGCPAGGWGWSLPSGWPNTDDTSSALTVLAGAGARPADAAVRAGVDWLLAMQNRNGSWGCFVRGGRLSLDAPSPEMTAHAVVALRACAPADLAARPIARALRFLGSVQRADGAVPALWYRNWVAGTAAALDAFAACDRAGDPVALRCRAWLLANQRADGAWGDADPSAEETAWALLGLLAAGVDPGDARAERAARWLCAQQLPDGGWTPTLLGIYFSSLLYHDDLIAGGYALQALGRHRRLLAERAP